MEISKEDRLIRSLVENIARRYRSPMDLIREIERLRGLGYNNQQIGEKLDVSNTTVGGMMALRKAGEERLLHAALSGKIPLWVAVEISKAETEEMQNDLLNAFESKELNFQDIRKAKRLMQKSGCWANNLATTRAAASPVPKRLWPPSGKNPSARS